MKPFLVRTAGLLLLATVLGSSAPAQQAREGAATGGDPAAAAIAQQVALRIRRLRDQEERILQELSPALRVLVEDLLNAPPDATPPLGEPSEAPRSVASESAPAKPDPGPVAAPEQRRKIAVGSSATSGGAVPAPTDDRATASDAGVDAANQSVPRCTLLEPWDRSGDGLISGADRAWRHFYLWFGEGRPREGDDLRSLFEGGLRSVDTKLIRTVDTKGSGGFADVLSDRVVLEVAQRHRGYRRAILAVDVDGLGRAEEPQLAGVSGTPLAGVVPIDPRDQVLMPDGTLRPFCP